MRLCNTKLKLMKDAQSALEELSSLVERQRQALPRDSEEILAALDHELERRFGEKERAIGALQLHKREHGC